MPDNYSVDSRLVNRLIYTVLAALLSIAGYMTAWALSFNSWQARVDAKLDEIMREVVMMEQHVQQPCHGVACERLRQLESHPHHRQMTPSDVDKQH
jgi:hypothetical protein